MIATRVLDTKINTMYSEFDRGLELDLVGIFSCLICYNSLLLNGNNQFFMYTSGGMAYAWMVVRSISTQIASPSEAQITNKIIDICFQIDVVLFTILFCWALRQAFAIYTSKNRKQIAEHKLRLLHICHSASEWFLAVIVLLVLVCLLGKALRPSLHVSRQDLSGKTALVIEGCQGNAFLHAQALASWKAEVVITCHDKVLAEEAVTALRKSSNSEVVASYHVDLTDIESVTQFAERWRTSAKSLHILIHGNLQACKETEQSVLAEPEIAEMFFIKNYIASYILDMRLFSILEANRPSRIIHLVDDCYKSGNFKVDKDWSGYLQTSGWQGTRRAAE
eukprot:107058-Hanusia_phi.AAC.1